MVVHLFGLFPYARGLYYALRFRNIKITFSFKTLLFYKLNI